MRISYWSSDVCSSDLSNGPWTVRHARLRRARPRRPSSPYHTARGAVMSASSARLSLIFSSIGHFYIHLFTVFYAVVVLTLGDEWNQIGRASWRESSLQDFTISIDRVS